MKQEDKDLLLKDLCARLPYGMIKCQYTKSGCNPETFEDTVETLDDAIVFIEPDIYNVFLYGEGTDVDIDDIKPYLRPMSSMTEEERRALLKYGTVGMDENDKVFDIYPYGMKRNMAVIDYLNAHHFDYRGLIEKGLALEAPEGMYKTE